MRAMMKRIRILVMAFWPLFWTFPYVLNEDCLRACRDALMRHPWWCRN